MDLLMKLGPFVLISIVMALGGILYSMIRTLKKVRLEYDKAKDKMRVMQITVDNPILPDGHIIQHKPTPWTLAGKTLYMQPLTFAAHRVFTENLTKFLTKYLTQIKGLKFLLIKDLISSETRNELTKSWQTIASNPKLMDEMLHLIDITFLSDKRINPDKLTVKEIENNCTWMEIIQTWQFLYAVNVEAVETFINVLLTPTKLGQEKQKVGSIYTNQQESQSKNSRHGTCQPRYSWYEDRQRETNV